MMSSNKGAGQQNFDCTQFISFDGILSADMARELVHLFEKIGFRVIPQEKISTEKIEYFKEYFRETFFELENDIFLGELDDWIDINKKPPQLVLNFINAIKELYQNKKLINFTVLLTSFAQAGKTAEQVFHISIDELESKLFLMSFHSAAAVVDNLILHIK